MSATTARSPGVTTLSIAATFAVVAGVGLAALALVSPAVAQDAPKADEAAAAATQAQSAEPSDHGHHRHDRHQAEATAKSAPAAKDEAGKTDTAHKTETSSADAAARQDQVCRTVKPTGSRLPKKVCATAATWAEVDAHGREGAKQFQQQMGDQSAQVRPPQGVVTAAP